MAWSISTQNDRFERHVVLEETITLPDSAGANETSANTSTIEHDLYGREFIVQLEVTEASAGNGALDARLQASLDESNWVNADTTLGLSIDTTGTNTGLAFADVGDKEAPFWRIQPFTDGTDTQDSMDVKVTVAFAG